MADDNTERDLLSIGTLAFGVVTDLEIGPDGSLYVVSISKAAIYRISGSVPARVPAASPVARLALVGLLIAAGLLALPVRTAIS